MSTPASVRIADDEGALAQHAAEAVREHARTALTTRGAFHVALSGGSTPRAAYAELVRRADAIDFTRWHVWFGDERCVPPEHADSNFRMAAESGLTHLLPSERVHRLHGEEREPAREARRYADELVAHLGSPPALDLVLLGLGPDGHTASLFPGSAALTEAHAWVAVGRAPKPPLTRLTLTLPTLNAARAVLFLAAGVEKAPALRAVLAPADASPLPARLVQPRHGTIQWLITRSLAERAGVVAAGVVPPSRAQ